MDYSYLVCWIAFGLITYSIAKKKGRNEIVALALGLLFGLLAVIGYALDKGTKDYQKAKAKKLLEK